MVTAMSNHVERLIAALDVAVLLTIVLIVRIFIFISLL
jgi:hypothetical protein